MGISAKPPPPPTYCTCNHIRVQHPRAGRCRACDCPEFVGPDD